MSQWYLYENEEVVGPFDSGDLEPRINEETLICRAGEKEWQEAREVPELNHLLRQSTPDDPTPPPGEGRGSTDSSQDEEETDIIEPTLENFLDICEQAADQTLIEEYEKHFQDYDRREQFILENEIDRRNLLPES